MSKRSTTEEFIEKARKIHGEKYDYSKVEYTNTLTKVCIICHIHGDFYQNPLKHLSGQGCPKCAKSHKKDFEYFINRAKEIHGDKYDYSNFLFKNMETKGEIYCKEHDNIFLMSPEKHLLGQGCHECKCDKIKKSKLKDLDYFIKKAKEVHGSKYDYSKSKYINNSTKLCIICPEHGEFWQTPNNHLNVKQGCPLCGRINTIENNTYNAKEFIEKANKVHNYKYDYSNIEYHGYNKKVCIICPKHGEFWQAPSNHLFGQGCPKCNMSHLERDIIQLLDSNSIKYEYQKHFKWLGRQSLDFYLPDYSIAIECQGAQHFLDTSWGGKSELDEIKKRDIIKKELCNLHNIKILYFSNLNIEYGYDVIEQHDKLLDEIKKYE